MNIVISLPHFTTSGGTNKAILGLAKGLLKNKANVLVLAEDIMFNKGFYHSVPYIKFKKNYIKYTVSQDMIKYIIENKNNIDLFIINGMFFPYAYLLSRVLKKQNINYILFPHDPYNKWMFKKNWFIKYPYFYLFEKRLIEDAFAIQTLSYKHNKYIFNLTKQKKVFSFPNGIDDDYKIEKINNKKKNYDHTIKIIFLGRHDYYNKGLDLLLYSIQNANKYNKKVDFVIQGPQTKDSVLLNKLKSKLKLDNVYFKEANFAKTSYEILSEYDVFILPSRYEGFSMAVAEAVLSGLPVIVSEEAGISDYIQKTNSGILCQPNINSITKSILTMIEEINTFDIEKSRKDLLSKLNWEIISLQILNKYKEELYG